MKKIILIQSVAQAVYGELDGDTIVKKIPLNFEVAKPDEWAQVPKALEDARLKLNDELNAQGGDDE